MAAQSTDAGRPVPILTGSAGFFTNVNGGETQLVPVIAPVLLVPLGDRWLIESRASFEGEFERKNGNGPFGGTVGKEVDYAQLDFIASRTVTVTVGRFLTPFGIYNERLYPIWIRSLQREPLIFPIATEASDGIMLRGGLPVTGKANLNYAVYFSTLSTVNKLEADRTVGGRMGFFLPGPRVEIGVSFRQLLQEERSRSAGFHFAWQPTAIPLNLRSEYAWSGDHGSGYWIEGAYRLSQIPHWQAVMRNAEVVGRAQQFFAGQITSSDAEEYGLPAVNTQQADFGLNYYFLDGLKGTASYGREFSSAGNANLWTVGIAYRFVVPLGRAQ
ncbi:MAG: hypothetical protein WAQ52_10690 [Terriglobales bacterium]